MAELVTAGLDATNKARAPYEARRTRVPERFTTDQG